MSDLAEALRRIAEARATAAPILDLGDLLLDSLPEELGCLSALRVLALGMEVPRQEGEELRWTYDSYRSGQRFTELNALQGLPRLEALGLSGQDVTALNALQGLPRLETLSLFYCTEVTTLEALRKLKGLQTLRMAFYGRLTDLGGLQGLTRLKALELTFCGVAELGTLRGLSGLQVLRLSNGPVSELEALRELNGLKTLDLSGCGGITKLDALQGLTRLETLDLDNCTGVTDLNPLQGLTGLETLNLSNCTGVTDLSALRKLKNLRTLHLNFCEGLKELIALRELKGLETLLMYGCDGVMEVEALRELKRLRTLSLSHCSGITQLDALQGLTHLETLNLSFLTHVREFSPVRNLLPQLNSLILYQSHFQDLPAELCGESSNDNVLDAVRVHYAEGDANGWRADEEVKVFVLGNGGVGKTQLCRRLRRLAYDPTEKSTHGVQLKHIDISLPGHETSVRLHLWDFGGQDIYHGSHTLFLQGRAVFVLLWTPNTEVGDYEEGGVRMRHRPLAYWLDYVQSVAGTESPVLIVQSKCDTDDDHRPLPVTLSKEFHSVRYLEFSAAQDNEEKKLQAVRSALQDAVAAVLDRHKTPDIPEGRFRLARQLRQILDDDKKHRRKKPRRIITQKQFQLLCKKNGQINMDAWQEALRFLHRRGVLFWRSELFQGRIILDQSWALTAIYSLFDRAKSLPTLFGRGRFTRDGLKELVWQDRADAEHRLFLDMMESCGICFRARCVNPGYYPFEWEYIAPELLPELPSPEVQHQLINMPKRPAPVRAEVRYTFLHEGVLRRFLSWLGNNVGDKAVYWRFGCWFHDPKSQVNVIVDSSWHNDRQHPGQGGITLDAWGEQSVPLLETLVARLKMLSPVQEPQVIRTGFLEHAQVGGRDDRDVVPDLIVSRQLSGIERMGDEALEMIDRLTLFRRVGEVVRAKAENGKLALSFIAEQLDEPFSSLRTRMEEVSGFFRRYFRRYEELDVPQDDEGMPKKRAESLKLFEKAQGKTFRIYPLGNRAWELACQYLDCWWLHTQ